MNVELMAGAVRRPSLVWGINVRIRDGVTANFGVLWWDCEIAVLRAHSRTWHEMEDGRRCCRGNSSPLAYQGIRSAGIPPEPKNPIPREGHW